MAAMTITACSTEEDVATGKAAGQNGTFQVSINVGPAETRAISVGGNNGHTLYTNWDNGDQVTVVKDGAVVSPAPLTADVSEGNSAYATLTGTLTGTFSVGDELTLYYHSADIDYTGQKGTLADVSTSKSFLTATSTVQQINQGSGAINNNSGHLVMSNAAYSPMQAYLEISFTDGDGTPLAITQLDIWTSGGKLLKTAPLGGEKTYATEANPLRVTPDAATDHFFLALRDEAGTSNTIYFRATTAADIYTYSQESNLAIGGYYYAASPKAMKHTSLLPGEFSVSKKKKVQFAVGNLQAVFAEPGSSCTWQFAEHQWDYVGDVAPNNTYNDGGSVSIPGTVDLFAWSTDDAGNYYGINRNDWNTGDRDGNFKDWGNLPIANGGNTANSGWRTLTKDEWNYIFNERPDAHSKYGSATVAGKYGLILLPDNYAGPAIEAIIFDWDNNIISASEWIAYEMAGAVFLPSAGWLNGTTLMDPTRGRYWSATADVNEKGAVSMSFSYTDYDVNSRPWRDNALSVRLVKDVQ